MLVRFSAGNILNNSGLCLYWKLYSVIILNATSELLHRGTQLLELLVKPCAGITNQKMKP